MPARARALDDARSQFIGIEHQTDNEIREIRKDLKDECRDEDCKPAASGAVERLLKRT